MPSLKRPQQAEGDVDDAEDMSPVPKAPRLATESFAKGSIIKIRVKNFMTYNEAEFRPGPRLNLILAPNGTGKSSLTCALCLGLAGDPKILGRGDNPKQFIRTGTNEAFTQITLGSDDPRRPITVERKLTKDSSSFRINGVVKTKCEVLQMLKDLNIQLDNLCQFLPQDKVVGFAQMKPGELLMESERAMGDASLYEQHKGLIGMQQGLQDSQRSTGALQRKLEEEERLMGELERDKERYDQRKNLEVQVVLREHKLLWFDVQDAIDEVNEMKRKRDQVRQRVQAAKDDLARQEAPLRAKEAEKGRIQKVVERQKTELVRLQDEGHTGHDRLQNLNPDIEQKWEALEGLSTQAQQHQENIAKLEADVAKLRADLAELPEELTQATQQAGSDMQALRREVQDLQNQINEIGMSVRELKESYDGYQRDLKKYQTDLNRLHSVKANKLRLLEKDRRGITEFTEWVEANQNRFKARVYGPILLEVSIRDQQHAKYLEHQVPWSVWCRFVTAYWEDQDLLVAESRRRGVQIITSNYSGNPDQPLQYPEGPASQYARYGITHTLDEVFEAPSIIKKVMNDEVGLTRAYIGTGRTNVEACLRSVSNLYTPESNFRARRSAYNPNARTETVTAIKDGLRYLGGPQEDGDERAKLEQLIAETQQGIRAIQSEEQAYKQEQARLEKEVEDKRKEQKKLDAEFQAQKRQRMKVAAALKNKEKQLEAAAKRPDPMLKEPQLRRDLDKLNATAHSLVLKLLDNTKANFEAMKAYCCSEATLKEIMSQIAALKEQGKGLSKEQRRWEDNLERLSEAIKRQTAEYKRRKEVAEKETGPLSEELKRKFKELSTERDALNAEMEDLNRQALGIQCANPRIMQEYEERSNRIKKLKEDFGNHSTALEALTAQVEEAKGQWLPELRQHVATINREFGRNLRAMGCSGEVGLSCGCEGGFDSCNAFDKYAIHIRVKFRDEEDMQLLTANRQSGGERAVCTILYIMALQAVTVCPFRVVDEINQGMDQINERKIFIQMVQAACRAGTPQCFMFTPKLLPDLPYSPDVTPMLIFNGVHSAELAAGFKDDSFTAGMPIVYDG